MSALRLLLCLLAVAAVANSARAEQEVWLAEGGRRAGQLQGLEAGGLLFEGEDPPGIPLEDIERVDFQPGFSSSRSNAVKNAFTYRYFEGTWDRLPEFDSLSPVQSGRAGNIDIRPRRRADHYGLVFSGTIFLPRDGQYVFYTRSDDGSKLYIDGEEVVDNDNLHAAAEKFGQVKLLAGVHDLKVTYFDADGEDLLEVSYQGPGIGKRPLVPSALSLVPIEAQPEKRSLLKQNFRIVSEETRRLEYPIRIPSDFQGAALLRVGVTHAADDSGDRGLVYKLVDATSNAVHNGFIKSKTTSWVEQEVGPGSRWTLVVEDQDTVFSGGHPGNGGSVEAWLVRTEPDPGWQVMLAGGDRLSGMLEGWDDQALTLRTGLRGDRTVQVPLDRVREAWHGAPSRVGEARDVRSAEAAGDRAFVVRDEALHSVDGICLGVQDEKLSFRYDDEDRKIGLDRLVGVVLAAGRRAPAWERFHQTVYLVSGDRLSGVWDGLDGDVLRLTTPWGAALSLPRREVLKVVFRNGRVVYLSDLDPVEVEEIPYFDRVMEHRSDTSFAGGPIQLRDEEYEKGLAVHSRCLLHYDVGGAFDRFLARVGFEQPMGYLGRAVIRVRGDDRVLFEEPAARGDGEPFDLDLPVRGVSRLTLEVDFGEGEDVGDRVLWANARCLRPDVGP